ncbi:MAG: nuclear transport factor 2 family protein [bacterium]
MTIETHKSIVRRFFMDVLTAGKMEVLEDILAPDCTYTDGGQLKYTTRVDFTNYVSEARKEFIKTKVIIEDIIAEGDSIAVRCTYHLETERKRYVIPVMGIFHFRSGKIAEIWRNTAASDDSELS